MPTPYEILNITPQATVEEIRTAYQTLISKHNGDQSENADALKTIQAAYDSLITPRAEQASNANLAMFSSHRLANIFTGAEKNLSGQQRSLEKVDPWQTKYLSKNKTYRPYAQTTISMLHNNISDPLRILDALLDQYLEPGSIFNFWGQAHTHTSLVIDLKKILLACEQDESFSNDIQNTLMKVFSRIDLEQVPFKSNGEFIELMNAFFSMYPLYLAYLPITHQLKEKLSLTPFDDILAGTIFRNLSHALVFPSQNIPAHTSEDIDILSASGQLSTAITKMIEGFNQSSNEADRRTYLANLATATPRLSAAVIENIVLPFVLSLLTKPNASNPYPNSLYKILRQIIQTMEYTQIERQVLPHLLQIKALFSTDCYKELLTDIALRSGASTTEKVTLPIFLSTIKSASSLAAIRKIIHLISPQTILRTIVPSLLKFEELGYSAYCEAFKLYAQLSKLADSSGENEKATWQEIILRLDKVFNSDIENSLIEARKGHLSALIDKIDALPAHVIMVEIIPVLFKKLKNPSYQMTVGTLLFLEALSQLPADKLDLNTKALIFKHLYAVNGSQSSPILFSAVVQFLPFNRDMKLFNDLFDKLIAQADLTTSQYSGSQALPILLEVVKHVDPKKLQNQLFPLVLAQTASGKIDLLSPLFQVLKIALTRVDQNFVMQSVYPEFFKRALNSQDVEAQLILPFTTKLSYEQSVHGAMKLIQSIDKGGPAKPQALLLQAISQDHALKIEQAQQVALLQEEQEDLVKIEFH